MNCKNCEYGLKQRCGDFEKIICTYEEGECVKITELEAQIEKMKCCGNCAKRGHICVAEEMQGNLCGKNKDKWEIRR